jgi:uncharacterized protein YqgC (DUF456 family)
VDHLLPMLLLAVCCIVGLVLVPFSLPGLWLMDLGIIGFGWLTDFRSVGVGTIALVAGLALVAELIEWWLGFRYTEKYGGSTRAGWGAFLGGLVGAMMGVPIPVLGSVIGAFIGAFAGAALFEYTRTRDSGTAARVGWGAVLGRTAAVGVKMGFGFVILIVAVIAVIRL